MLDSELSLFSRFFSFGKQLLIACWRGLLLLLIGVGLPLLLVEEFGVYLGVFPASIALFLLLLHLRKWRSLIYFNTVIIGSMILNRAAKAYWHRSRPSLWEWPVSKIDFSFPSGHAMSSMSFVTALLILTWGTRWFISTLTAGSLFVVSIA